MKTHSARMLAGLAASVFLGACATEPTATEREFGESVRSMIVAQTYDQSTLASPPEGAIESTDGEMLRSALETYRTTLSEQGDVGEEISISLGGQ